MGDDYYAILEVTPDASPEDIKKAYHKMALKWHPDKNPDSKRAEAERRFKKVGEAYQVLSNSTTRSGYDQRRRQQRSGGSGGGQNFAGFQGFVFRDAEELFREFFGQHVDFQAAGTDDLGQAAPGQHHGGGGVQASVMSVSISTNIDRDGTQTTTKTVIENGVKTVTVTRNGAVTEQRVTNLSDQTTTVTKSAPATLKRRVNGGGVKTKKKN